MKLPDRESLFERFEQYTDDQLMEVLRNYKHYQDQAIEVAVEIALKRELIHSRQDLFSPEFNGVTPRPRKIFPLLDANQTTKMLRSTLRIIYLITIVPLIFTVLNLKNGDFLQIILWGAVTVAWLLVTRIIEKKRIAGLVFFLYAFFFCFHVIYFSGYRYSFKPGITDLIVYLIPVLVFFYLLNYLYVLLRRNSP